MSIPAIGSTGTTSTTASATGATTNTSSTAAGGFSSLDQNTFLKLMVAQLRNQDPMNPQDSSQFLAQTAQFTSLEKLTAVATQTAAANQQQMAFGASSLVGKQVTYLAADGKTQVSGSVASVTFTSEGPVLTVGSTDLPFSSVLSVGGPPAKTVIDASTGTGAATGTTTP